MTTSAVMPTYARYDLSFETGSGAWLTTTDGQRYLDFGAGIAVTALGHAHPHLVEALRDQAGRLWHTSNLYRIPGQERLAARLVEATFADAVFFCNSGAEAVEASLKVARRYQSEVKQQPEKNRVIVTRDAFHGRTMATIAAAKNPKHVKGFDPLLDGFDQVPFGNLNEARAAVTGETGAILVEPIQGEGGINAAPDGYLRGLRQMADEYGLVLIYDEVQSGMGRTGKLFAHQWHPDQAPDVMAIAKGLGGGFPVGACLTNAELTKGLPAGSHGSTFGGNPLAMAVGNAVLDVLQEDGFLAHVAEAGRLLMQRLTDLCTTHPNLYAEVSGQGLMLGLRCAPTVENGKVVAAFLKQGLLTVPAANNVVRILPPLIIGTEEIEAAYAMMQAASLTLTTEAA